MPVIQSKLFVLKKVLNLSQCHYKNSRTSMDLPSKKVLLLFFSNMIQNTVNIQNQM